MLDDHLGADVLAGQGNEAIDREARHPAGERSQISLSQRPLMRQTTMVVGFGIRTRFFDSLAEERSDRLEGRRGDTGCSCSRQSLKVR